MYTLVDTQGLIMRAWTVKGDNAAITDPETGKTHNTWEYGFENFFDFAFQKLVRDAGADANKIIFVFDGGSEFRKTLYSGYKSGRKDSFSELGRKELSRLLNEVKKALYKLGFTCVIQDGEEADDVIAYLVKNLPGMKRVVTIDGDLVVLGDYPNTLVSLMKVGGSVESYSDCPDVPLQLLTPRQFSCRHITLEKAIVGDTSDEYKGVPGMGPKAFQGLLEAYGEDGLEDISTLVQSNNKDELADIAQENECKLLTKMVENWDDLTLSYKLAKLYPERINRIANNKKYPLQWHKGVPDKAYVESLAKRLNPQNLEDEYPWLVDFMPESYLVEQQDYEEAMELLAEWLTLSPSVGWDYETYDENEYENLQEVARGQFVDVLSARVAGVSVALGPLSNKALYFPLNHMNTNNCTKDQVKSVVEWITALSIPTVAHNSSFEHTVTKLNFDIHGRDYTDTAMFAKNLFENEEFGLKYLSKRHLNYTQQTYEEVLGTEKDMRGLSGEHVLDYGCDDSVVANQLYWLFRPMAEIEGSYDFVTQYDIPTLEEIVEGHIKGVDFDPDYFQERKEANENKLEQLSHDVEQTLAKHCSQPNEKFVKQWFDDDIPYLTAKFKEKNGGDNSDALAEHLEEKYTDYLAKSCYSIPVEIPQKIEFIPTPSKIIKVLECLGIYVEKDQFKSVNGRSLTNLMTTIGDDLEVSPEASRFMQLLISCSTQELKDRKGENYTNLCDFGSEVLSNNAPKKLSREPLNLGSSNQLKGVLYGMLGLPIRIRTKVKKGDFRDTHGLQGGASSNEDAINYALVFDYTDDNSWQKQLLIKLRDAAKTTTAISRIWSRYDKWIYPHDGKVHATFNQSATTSHRPTGSNPNLLQVPKRDGGEVRSCFIGGKTETGEDKLVVSIDFNGQELRIQASESEDPTLLSAYIGDNKRDVHCLTATSIGTTILANKMPEFDLSKLEMSGSEIDYQFFESAYKGRIEVDSDVQKALKFARDASKPVNFGVIYGGTGKTVALELLVSVDIGDAIVDKLQGKYPGIWSWRESVLDFARNNGYVQTVYGAVRHCWPDIIQSDSYIRSGVERSVCNFLIQGTAADILKVVMAEVMREEVMQRTESTLLAPFYDEKATITPVKHLVDYVTNTCRIMSITPPGHKVPMVPEVSIGFNWGNQIELGASPDEDAILSGVEKLYKAKG